ncbi:MAG: hypothetical protein ABW092_19955 [Candidatus Thiodiazotropha sp.]
MKPEQREDSFQQDRACAYSLRDLRLIHKNQQHQRSLVLLAHNSQDLVQLFRHSFSSPISSYKPLWIDVRTLTQCNSVNHVHTIDSPVLLQHLQTFRNTSVHPSELDNELNQSATFTSLLQESGKQLFILDSGWKELPTHYGLIENQEEYPLSNIFHFDRNLDQNSSPSRQQLYTEIKQRMIEIKLLKRTLAIAKIRLATADDRLNKTLDHESEFLRLQESSETFREETAKKISTLSAERFDLECSLNKLREQLNGQQAIEQMQITSLQQALAKAEDELAQTQKLHNQRETELQTALDDAKSSETQTVETLNFKIGQLEQNHGLLEEELKQSRKQLAQAQEESQEKESSRQKLQQDKADLANYLQLETSRTLEFAQQAQSTDEHRQRLESELNALQQSVRETELEHKNEILSIRGTLEETLQQSQADTLKLQAQMNQALEAEKQHTRDEQARLKAVIDELNEQMEADHADADRQLIEAQQQAQAEYQTLQERMDQALEAEKQHTRDEQSRLKAVIDELNQQMQADHADAERQLNEAQQQAQAEYQTLQERMDQALETEKQQAREEKSRLESAIEGLNGKLDAIRIEADQLRDKGIEQEALLEQEHKKAKSLRHLLKRTKKMLDNRRKQLTEAERIQQETLSELQQELKTSQEAWEKVTESEVAAQVAKQELASLRRELEGEVVNLQAQLEHLQESSDKSLSQLREENEKLQKSLSEIKEGSKITDVTIRKLRSDRHYLRETKSRIEDQLAKLKAEAIVAEEENEALRLELEAKSTNSQVVALRRAEAENAILKREIEGLREVQLEMESQLNGDTDNELRELRNTLKSTEVKLAKAQKLADQTKDLLRERQTMENANELLSDDLDSLTKDKESLTVERDRLKKELSDLQGR